MEQVAAQAARAAAEHRDQRALLERQECLEHLAQRARAVPQVQVERQALLELRDRRVRRECRARKVRRERLELAE